MTNDKPITAEAAFQSALELVNQGQLKAAIASCKAAIAQHPDDVRLNAMVGGLLLSAKDLAGAETYLRQAARLAPNFAKVHEDLGYLLLESGQIDDAIQTLTHATTLNPDSPNGRRWLAEAHRRAETSPPEESSNADDLDPLTLALKRAQAIQASGQTQAAEAAYNQLLATHPNDVKVLLAVAAVCADNKQLTEAETLYRRAISQAPRDAAIYIRFGDFLSQQNRQLDAVLYLTQAAELEPKNTQVSLQLAWALVRSGKTSDAIDQFQAVLSLQPDHQGAWLGLGHTLKTVGKQSEAIAAYRQCIKVHPHNGEVYWSLANLKTFRFTDNDTRAMSAALQREDLTDQSRVNFLFALAKDFEDKGDFQQAWDCYHSGNTLQQSLEHYSAKETEVSHDAIATAFSRDFIKSHRNHGDNSAAPIFIIGLPRSGSTLLEQILASHSMVEGTAELPYVKRLSSSLTHELGKPITYPADLAKLSATDFKHLGATYLARAAPHRLMGTPRFIDKMPNNFSHVGLIKLVLPNAKIIDARRYPLDSTLSCYRQLFSRGQTFVYSLEDIGRYFLEYQRMMDHWHEVLPGEVLTVQYEEVATDLESQVRRILDYCELPFEEACLRFHENDRPVRTASSEQVRQPIHTGAIHQWRKFEPYLGELIDTLAPVLPRYQQYEEINLR